MIKRSFLKTVIFSDKARNWSFPCLLYCRVCGKAEQGKLPVKKKKSLSNKQTERALFKNCSCTVTTLTSTGHGPR